MHAVAPIQPKEHHATSLKPQKCSENFHRNTLMTQTHLKLSLLPWQHLLLIVLLHSCHQSLGQQPAAAATTTTRGRWALLQSSIGISAMHMQLLNNDKVVIFDRTDFGPSNISLANGKCSSNDPQELALKVDCTAHSVEYDVATNSVRPLTVLTDVLCSSGSVMPDGTLVQTGGFNVGDRNVRVYKPCSSGSIDCDWQEVSNGLLQRRWYATNHILPDSRQIIIGGRRQFNYEFYPKTAATNRVFKLPFLAQTNDPNIENNLYPFVFLNVDGNLFIFANNRAILLDYKKNIVVKNYPQLPDGNPRCYPSSGSAVLLPLKKLQGSATKAEVLVCGGAPKDAFANARKGNFVGALDSCGRISINDPNPQWVMETMPLARVMGDMLLLPNGHVLIINGASSGTAGWEYGRNPVLSPVIYRPDHKIGSRFQVQNPSTVPRMYHSTAVLLRDGRILVSGSNPHLLYKFTGVLYPTELSIEAFSPPYLDPAVADLRPRIISPGSQSQVGYGRRLVIRFTISGKLKGNLVTVTLVAPSFNTHGFSMNQRVLLLGGGDNNVKIVGKSTYQTAVLTPGSGILAPSGFYLLFVVHQDIPSQGIWVHLL